jgi:2-dehydro-3-deoxygluconokinase
MELTIKPKKNCRWDIIGLGEVMLRFDPGDRRIATARSFEVCEGGGEYNVARGLKRCFGLDAAIVTAFADDPVGRLLQDFIYQGGVDQSLIRWVEHDGVGHATRNGLNFTERGFGVRAALGSYDRGHTAVSQLKPGEIDWDEIFGKHGTRWFHTGGIFSALSATTPEVALEAMQAAKRHGTTVSYDLNYRPSLWRSHGGKKTAQEVNRRIAPHVDVMLGNEEDFSAALGFEVPGMDEHHSTFEVEGFKQMIATVDQAKNRDNLEIFDRVGGGDSFASGLIYGFLAGHDPQWAVECGAAHGALAMTTPGDTSMATLQEVTQVMKGVGARIAR